MEVKLVSEQQNEIIFAKTQEVSGAMDNEHGKHHNDILTTTLEVNVMDTTALTSQLPIRGLVLESWFREVVTNVLASRPDASDKIVTRLEVKKGHPPIVKIHLSGSFITELVSQFLERCTIRVNLCLSTGEVETLKFFSHGVPFNLDDGKVAFELVLTEPVFTQDILKKVTYKGTISIIMCALGNSLSKLGGLYLTEEICCDFSLIAEDKTSHLCHEVLLTLHSPVLRKAIQKLESEEGQKKSLELELSATGVKALIKFIYYTHYSDALDNPSLALELLKASDKDKYSMRGLNITMTDVLLTQANACYSFEVAVELYHYCLEMARYEELKWKAVKVIKSKEELKNPNVCVGRLASTEFHTL